MIVGKPSFPLGKVRFRGYVKLPGSTAFFFETHDTNGVVLQPRFQVDEDDFTGTILLLNRNVFELWNRRGYVTDGSDGSAKMSCFSYLMLFVSLETFEVA